jgi:FKBP-type peptidyl-prolyl cis-trans isomerase
MKRIRTTMTALLAGGCLILFAGCGDEEDGAKEIIVSTPKGDVVMRYIDLVPGTGKVIKKGDWIRIHYTGWSEGGSRLPGSYEKGQPPKMLVGKGQGLLGWHEGIPGMKVGGKRKLFIPPELAFKDKGGLDGRVKPNAKVIYEIEVVDIITNPEDLDEDVLGQ